MVIDPRAMAVALVTHDTQSPSLIASSLPQNAGFPEKVVIPLHMLPEQSMFPWPPVHGTSSGSTRSYNTRSGRACPALVAARRSVPLSAGVHVPRGALAPKTKLLACAE